MHPAMNFIKDGLLNAASAYEMKRFDGTAEWHEGDQKWDVTLKLVFRREVDELSLQLIIREVLASAAKIRAVSGSFNRKFIITARPHANVFEGVDDAEFAFRKIANDDSPLVIMDDWRPEDDEQ